MTREEALQILDTIPTIGEQVDALEMAIQALSQEPCELLIIKSDILLHQDDRKKWMESIKREKENGVIILPPYFEPLLVPNDIEINIEQEPCDDTVSIRKDVLKCRVGKLVVYNVEWLKKHWQMEMDIVCGVKPCDDAISRQAVLDMAEDMTDQFGNKHRVVTEGLISMLPPVNPKPKTGHWIRELIRNEKGGCIGAKRICSECDTDNKHDEYMNYCPNCGAKMESEE